MMGHICINLFNFQWLNNNFVILLNFVFGGLECAVHNILVMELFVCLNNFKSKE